MCLVKLHISKSVSALSGVSNRLGLISLKKSTSGLEIFLGRGKVYDFIRKQDE